MKRTAIAAAAAFTLLTMSIGSAVQASSPFDPPSVPAPSAPTPQRAPGSRPTPFDVARMRDQIDLSALPSRVDPNKVVSAIVVLSADSVSDAKEKAEQAGAVFDRGAAEREAARSQAEVTTRVEGAGVRVEHGTTQVLNSLIVTGAVKDLRTVSSMLGVARVSLSRTIRRSNVHSNAATGVEQVWQSLGLTGKGMTIGIIDTGIDYTHADFGGSGDPADFRNNDGTIIEGGSFPTAKVSGGYDFVGDTYDGFDSLTVTPDRDPLDCEGHGTHVAGTAAGQGVLADGTTYRGPYTQAAVDAQQWKVHPGSAPEAQIRAYRVFSCFGSTTDAIIVQAVDRAVADHVDIISMSLGADFGGANDPLALAVDHATRMGVLSVVAAGNALQRPYSVGTPSTASTALSVGAADFFPGQDEITTYGRIDITGDITANKANHNAFDYPNGPVTGTLMHVADACVPGSLEAAAGQIAIATFDPFGTHIDPATGVEVANCDLGAYFDNVDTTAAKAVFVVNDEFLDETNFAYGAVPIVAVTSAEAASYLDGSQVTLTKNPDTIEYVPNPDYGTTAWFTSAGMRDDSTMKPDVAAPGARVTSASIGTGSKGVENSGTSMATPHVAGIAALVRQAHPDWSPLAVKGALMSTANPSAITSYDVALDGTGLVSATAAVGTQQWLSTADGLHNVSFGFNELSGPYRSTKSITINNTSRTAVTYDVTASVNALPGITGLGVTVTPSVVRVGPRSTATVSVTLSLRDPQHLPAPTFDDPYTCSGCAWVKGLLVATPRTTGLSALRAPIGMVPTALSDVTAQPQRGTGALRQYAATTRIANSGIHTSDVDVYQWLLGDATGDATDTIAPDIRDVGVRVGDQQTCVDQIDTDGDGFPDTCVFVTEPYLQIAVDTGNRFATNWANDYETSFDLDNDGTDDLLFIQAAFSFFSWFAYSALIDLHTEAILWFDTDNWRLNDSVVQASFPARLLDAAGANGAYTVHTESFTQNSLGHDLTSTAKYDHHHPAVNTAPTMSIAPGKSVTITNTIDVAAADAQGTLGWLVVASSDAAGAKKADRVPLKFATR